ncbi:MAG: mandelate racemase [Rhizobiaceae bacterium]|nr:MAG: mandelate racemase [Rhizobiaceae bacterium]
MENGLVIRSVRTRAVRVPLNFTLGTSAAIVRSVPLVLMDLVSADGVEGRSYVFCYTSAGAKAVAAHAAEAVALLEKSPVSPRRLWEVAARRLALLGVTGPVRMALSALDVALWDAIAIRAAMPLATLLGGAPRALKAYDSRGLGLMPKEQLAAEVDKLLAGGLRALKLRLGYPTVDEDLAAVRLVRGRMPDGSELMVDYNQALDLHEATRRGLALQAEGLTWLEEPIRHDAYQDYAALCRKLDLPLQIGENFNGPEAMMDAVLAGAVDLAMPDVSRIGGVTGWMQAAGLASARGIPLSSHLMPEISAHLLAASPTAHWLEYVDWADCLLLQPLRIANGEAIVPSRPGLGLEWNEDMIGRLERMD